MYPRVPSLADLTALIAVDEHGSVSGAARALGRNQQTVSTQIGRVEKQLGLTAFHRSPYGMTTTPEGLVVVRAGRDLLAAATLFDAAVAEFSGRVPQRVDVAVSHTIAELHFPGWAAAFHEHHPEVHLVMTQANSAGVRDLVAAGTVPLGIVEGGQERHGLVETDIGTDELVVVAPTGHPWAEPGFELTLADLQAEPLVVREPGSGSREVAEQVLGELAPPAGEFGSLAAQRSGIISLHAPGIVAAGAVADSITLGRLVQVATPGITFRRVLRVVQLRGSHTPPVLQDFVDLVAHTGGHVHVNGC